MSPDLPRAPRSTSTAWDLSVDEIRWTLAPLPPPDTNVSSLEAAVDSYRAVTLAAFEYIRELTLALDRAQEQHDRLVDEYRALRAQTMRDAT